MKLGTLVSWAVFAVVAVGLGLVVVSVADGWADWVVLGAIVMTAIGFGIAYYARETPIGRRTFVREHGGRKR